MNNYPGGGWEKLPNRLLDPEFFWDEEEGEEELRSECCDALPLNTVIDGSAICSCCKKWAKFIEEGGDCG